MARQHTTVAIRIVVFALAGLVICLPGMVHIPKAAADGLNSRFDKVNNPVSSAAATHLVGFDITDFTNPLGSVEIEFCSNSPLPGTACTAPAGFDLTGSTLGTQTGNTGFSKDGLSTANRFVMSRAPSLALAGTSTYELLNVTNPSAVGTYYGRIRTYSSNNLTGPVREANGIALSTSQAFNVNAEVPPYLKFCLAVQITNFDCSTATNFSIDWGEFSKTQSSAASSQFVVATNGDFGYNVTVVGTTLTSGNNVIPAFSVPSAPVHGTSHFGMNLRSNNNPAVGSDPTGYPSGGPSANYGTPNLFMFQNNDVVASSAGVSDNKKYTTSYVADVSSAQQPGVYSTTLSYICLANF